MGQSIGKENAILLAKTEWWETRAPREIVGFQLFVDELCMPFDKFHEAVEAAIGRPVWTHEFGVNVEGLKGEFLGKKPAPTIDEIMGLIPEEKRIPIVVGEK